MIITPQEVSYVLETLIQVRDDPYGVSPEVDECIELMQALLDSYTGNLYQDVLKE